MTRYLSIPMTLLCSIALIDPSAVCRAGEDIYESKVKPLLRERCFACHGSLKQEGGLRLDTAEFIKQGGDSGAAVDVKSGPEASYLIERVADKDPGYRMPPEFEGEPLTHEEVELLSSWIEAGAPAPADEKPEKDPREHWAFQAVVKPTLPDGSRPGWDSNPIDLWIAKGHADQGLTPQTPVDRLKLLRRVSYDLIGLPPTAEQIAACLNDPSPDWYEKTVEQLLAGPRHGERWGRHWMDVWRYSDWWGLNKQLRNSQKNIWHWRDWIVESVNEDLPYDEMVRLMLAADELAPDDPDKLRATGFLARNYYIFNRMRWMDETVEHVGKGLLGLTMNCAKCHDHKFDPIAQVDYYQMRAFFEPYLVRQDMVPGETDFNRNGIPRAFDALLDEPTYLYIRGDESQPDTSTALEPGVPEILRFDDLEIQEVSLPPVASQPARQPWVLQNYIEVAKQRMAAAEKKRTAAEQALKRAESAATEQPLPLAADTNNATFQPIKEDFAQLDSSRWKTESGKWQLEDDGLRQTMDGPQRSVLQLLQDVPQNFEATLRFRLHGGSRYRSVGIAFDAPADGGDEPRYLVYASGFANEQKLQAAFDNGNWNYPGDGRQLITLDVETDYTLRLQVRDRLMNITLNGEPLLAWNSPIPRSSGSLQLVTFDALATLRQFELKTLPDEVELVPATGGSSSPTDVLTEARLELSLASARYHEALAGFESVQQRAAAMQTSWSSESTAEISAAKQAAIRAEREHAVAKAMLDLAEAEAAVARSTGDPKTAAEKKKTTAEAALTKAEKALEGDYEKASFTPLTGAKWSATRFQHTGRDDPKVEFPNKSTGRRTALAEWITDERNPLTARVAVNHIWTRHFGQPLVQTTFDFGRNGSEPVYVDLLNWLAADFVEHGWSMKHLHRLIVLSETYRMGSSLNGRSAEKAKDPDNHYFWRRPPIRQESQVVRDAVLALAGTLDKTMGGAPVLPNEQDASKRRSLYFFHSNNERNLFLTTFDEAAVAECYQREQSVVPQQALALSNSALVLDASQKIAANISATHESDQAFIEHAFLLLLGFEAGGEEIANCKAALGSWEQLPDGTRETARANLIWTLLNHNDFVTLR